MSMPMDPNDLCDGETEFGWGGGQFPPGIANNEGQSRGQDDFGSAYPDIALNASTGDESDNYARAVADRRTDPTDPDSNRDFETYGNPDRFGAQPALVQAAPQRNSPTREEWEQQKLQRKP